MSATRLEDVDYYLPLYDEDGQIDPEAHYHRTQLAAARDFGLPGVSDGAVDMIRSIFPGITGTATDLAPDIREALIGLGKLIERADPEDPATDDAIESAIAGIRDQITTK
jgi:hypothetical protein